MRQTMVRVSWPIVTDCNELLALLCPARSNLSAMRSFQVVTRSSLTGEPLSLNSGISCPLEVTWIWNCYQNVA